MTKRELIDEITRLNPTASPTFLADFDASELAEYLEHLHWACPLAEIPADIDAEPPPQPVEAGPLQLAG